MNLLGHTLREIQSGYFAKHIGDLNVWAYQIGARWYVRVENVDSSVVVTCDSATAQGAAAKVEERIKRHLPGWAGALFGEERRVA